MFIGNEELFMTVHKFFVSNCITRRLIGKVLRLLEVGHVGPREFSVLSSAFSLRLYRVQNVLGSL